jgi:hypothetical protein
VKYVKLFEEFINENVESQNDINLLTQHCYELLAKRILKILNEWAEDVLVPLSEHKEDASESDYKSWLRMAVRNFAHRYFSKGRGVKLTNRDLRKVKGVSNKFADFLKAKNHKNRTLSFIFIDFRYDIYNLGLYSSNKNLVSLYFDNSETLDLHYAFKQLIETILFMHDDIIKNGFDISAAKAFIINSTTQFIKITAHEFQHAYDYYRAGFIYLDKKEKEEVAHLRNVDYWEWHKHYIKFPVEISADYTGVVTDLMRYIDKFPTFMDFLKKFKEEFRGYEDLDKKTQKRLISRLYVQYMEST